MPTTRYSVFDGEIISENRAGVQHDYVSDPLGNTIALLDNTQTQTDQWAYFPYGEYVQVTGTTATPMTFVGRKSCRQDSSGTRSYMQYRFVDMPKARWITQDPIGFDSGESNLYPYVGNNPISRTDPNGLSTYELCLGIGPKGRSMIIDLPGFGNCLKNACNKFTAKQVGDECLKAIGKLVHPGSKAKGWEIIVDIGDDWAKCVGEAKLPTIGTIVACFLKALGKAAIAECKSEAVQKVLEPIVTSCLRSHTKGYCNHNPGIHKVS